MGGCTGEGSEGGGREGTGGWHFVEDRCCKGDNGGLGRGDMKWGLQMSRLKCGGDGETGGQGVEVADHEFYARLIIGGVWDRVGENLGDGVVQKVRQSS